VDEFLQKVKLQGYTERPVALGIPVDDLSEPDPRPVQATEKHLRGR